MEKNTKKLISILKILVPMCVGAGTVYLANYKKIDFMNRYPQFLKADKFVKETLEIAPPENIDDKTVGKAYFALYGDKYTLMEESVDPNSVKYALDTVNDSSTAKKSGFKIQFNEKEEPYFSAIVSGMPADKQGIKVGDIIKNVDDFEVTEYKHAIRLLGDDGETAKIIIERDGKEIAMDFVRCSDEEISTGVESEMYGDTLYVSLDSVSSEIVEPFKETVANADFDSIIIDLRNNGGGYAEKAVDIADLFIGESQTVLYAQNGEKSVYTTTADGEYNVPIVVLINEKTASAAEIFTALLKQYGDAKLVGMNTFGKGIYQNKAIFAGGSVKYTDGYYTVGDWECYQGIGIKPDYEIDMDSDYIGEINDIQLQFAVNLLK